MSTSARERILAKIRRSFGDRREQFGRKPFGGYPLSFKRRAVMAVTKGIAPGRVAEAAGISEPSVRTWCKELKVKIESPTELKLIEEAPVPTGAAHIHFQSGLRLEIPVEALTPAFIKRLNGVAP